MKFSEVRFNSVEDYLNDTRANTTISGRDRLVDSWAGDVQREFSGFRHGESSTVPQPTSVPEVACNEFVEYVTQKFFPADGSWINTVDKDEQTIKALNVLRRRIGESNFYSTIAGFIKNGILYNTALITCEYGGRELNFLNYDPFNNNVRVIDSDLIKRGFIHTKRHITAIKEIYKTDGLGLDGEGYIDTYLLYFPTIKRYIRGGKTAPNENFFSIEIYENQILVRKDNIIPTFPTFPIHAFRPNNIRSMGQEALGPAIELKTFVYELRKRIKYVNDPSLVMPDSYFNTLRDVLKKPPEAVLKEGLPIPIPPGHDKADIATIKLENDIPVDIQYIQMLVHDIFHIFKAELVTRSKLVGLSTAEAAQREIGVHNELAPLFGHVVSITAKNLITRAVSLLQNDDAEYKKVAGKKIIDIRTDFYLKSVHKYEKIDKMMRLLEVVGAIGAINPSDVQIFKGDEFLERFARELEIPGVLASPDEVDQQRQAMSQAATQPQVDEAKAEKDQSDALLKQAQAQQIEGGLA